MGMSIDTVSKWLKIQRDQRNNKLNHLAPSLIGDKRMKSLDTAISYLEDYQKLLCKYQKIVDIVSLNGEEFKQCGLKELKEILEVIAGGNED